MTIIRVRRGLRPAAAGIVQTKVLDESLTVSDAVVRILYANRQMSDTISLADSAVNAATDSLTNNAYSSYTTRVIDSATSSDVAGGTTRTVTVNGVSGSYQCYKTIQFAVTDFLTQGGRRLIILPTATYTVTSKVTFPNATGTSDTNRIVLMGDPASTAPTILFSSASGAWFDPVLNNASKYITFRKLEITSNDTTWAGEGGGIYCSDPSHDFTGLVVEWCYIHDIQYGDNTGGVYLKGEYTGVIVRYSKIKNITNRGNTHNGAGVFSYQTGNVLIHHCDISGCGANIFRKRCTSTSPNGWTIRNCKFFDALESCILYSEQGAGDTGHFEGDRVYLNLFYNSVFGVFFNPGENTEQSTDLQIYQNTFAEDIQYGVYGWAMTAIQYHSNIGCSNTDKFTFETPTGHPWLNGISLFNYNAWYTGGGGNNWRMPTTYASFAAWQAATGGPLSASPDANGTSFGTLSTHFTNTATRDYSLKAGSALRGAGQNGVNMGFDWTDYGAGW